MNMRDSVASRIVLTTNDILKTALQVYHNADLDRRSILIAVGVGHGHAVNPGLLSPRAIRT